ncbi:scarecrow-like protein 3 [Phtheirospermum japonicum]|uniref:Scarecrow-like protein 3 n=1 Tax=Phtheirospermum japonicum TaxID=374723 RepID=A0A830CV37_9LAMI|nr:scarecrow-like protein 3 [Phtheirospermum japonicum]
MFQEDGSSSVTSSSPQMFPMMSLPPSLISPYPWLKQLKPEERGLYLIHLLVTCANHVASGGLENANTALDQISYLASPQGDTMQRIASYFAEALADRVLRAWPGVYKAFHSTKIPVFAEQILVKKLFSEHLLFTKIASVISNQSIVESMEGEKVVHVIDLNATEPMQWRALIRDLSARPEGPPHLRITGIHQKKEVLDHMAHVLTDEAEKLDLPFQFNPIISKLENLDFDKLRVKTGEALAISSIMQFHTLLASDDDNNKKSPWSNIDVFLSVLWGLSPKVVVVTEQESDHNGPGLTERLSEALYYYAALFDCLESTLPRSSSQRLRMEKALLGEEIKNIIACEGAERRERHEKMERWGRRFESAGFGNVGLSYYGMLQAKRLVQSYGKCEGYRIREENGCVVICWQDRPILSVSAWRFRR